MRVTKPNYDAVRYVAEHIRERDATEFFAVSPFDSLAEMKKGLVARYGARDDTYLFTDADGTPIAVGAMVQHRPNVVTLAFFATDEFPTIGKALTRFVKQRLFPQYVARGVHRIECVSLSSYDEAHRWIRTLGLTDEADLKAFGRAKEDFTQFAWGKSMTAVETLLSMADKEAAKGHRFTEANFRKAADEGEDSAQRYLDMVRAVGRAAKSILAKNKG